MVTVSRDTPCLYLSAVTKDRLPIFRTARLKEITCSGLDEARRSAGFGLYAYVIMPDHLHALTDGTRKPSDVLRFIKGIASRRVIGYLKENGYSSSLQKLRIHTKERGHEYSLWQHHSNVFLLTSESAFMQKVSYMHMNAVRAALAESAEAYRWSSARCWAKRMKEDEPLLVDLGQITWRAPR